MWPPCRIDFPNGSKNAQIDLQPRSRLLQTPQRGPGRLTTRRRAQTWCSLFVAPCAPEGTPPLSLAAFLSSLSAPERKLIPPLLCRKVEDRCLEHSRRRSLFPHRLLQTLNRF